MQIVLGVSMTPAAVRMVLVEGGNGDGVTVDTGVFRGPDDVIAQVLAATEGTRENAAEGGHHLVATGVAWTDHAQAARLRNGLRTNGIDDVVLVSELHAAGALAQAIGAATGVQRTALLLLEQDIATLAVVRTIDGAVVGVRSHSLHTTDAVAELQAMVAAFEGTDEPPEAVFVVGSGVDVAAVAAQVSRRTALPVHAPGDADFALARGAALAAAGTPRYEAATVGIASADDLTAADLTAAGITQLRYLGPLGYSAVPDDDDEARGTDDCDECDDGPAAIGDSAEQKPFLLVGSALASVFVVGIVSLVISLAVSIRPAVEQRPDDGASPVPALRAPSLAPETIEAPVPVVQQAPRTVVVQRPGAAVLPGPSAPAVAVAIPAPAAAPAVPPPAAVPAVPAAPAAPAAPPVIPVPAAVPAPVIPPAVLAPILPALLPQVFQPPVRTTPLPRYPSTASTSPTSPPSLTPTAAAPSSETYAPTPSQTPSQTASQAPSQAPSQIPSSDSSGAEEPSAPTTPTASTTPVLPLWPGFSG